MTYFQSTIPPLFDKRKSIIKAWNDVCTIHAKTESELAEHVKDFLKESDEHNLRIPAKKYSSYVKNEKWRGWVIDSSGYH